MRKPFEIGDIVFLIHLQRVVKIRDEYEVMVANDTSERGIRLATEFEIQEGL